MTLSVSSSKKNLSLCTLLPSHTPFSLSNSNSNSRDNTSKFPKDNIEGSFFAIVASKKKQSKKQSVGENGIKDLRPNGGHLWWEKRCCGKCLKIDWRWEDNRHLGRPWVPSEMPMTLTKSTLLTFTAEHVCDLLVEDGSRWDEDRLGALFDEEICQRILSIPIDVELGGDRWSWDFDRSGQYTVKMGYRNAMLESWGQLNLGLDVDEEATTRFWKRLWKLPIISRYKVFLWRACRGILPTVESLEERGMDIDELCIMCNNAHEDVFHALIDCPELQLMWVNANFDYSSRFYHANILEWLVVEVGGWKDEQVAFLAVAVYHAWERRNKKKFANEIIKVEELWPRVERMMEEIQVAAFTDNQNIMELPTVKWEKPEYPFMKLNVDAAGSKSGGGAMGGLLLNSTSSCDGVFMSCVHFSSDPILLEAMAIK
ncbi:uncharacterized protein G2W53_015702 [Senna tora]|uniref:Reverse transcriptase zinc-binding domain-containing protein n=1 Tax=Senna tora TaxID=362788 RepID=A0A835C621_9FABA|nr:uncharacterized protein G2W53_015702 [Senna tora]